MSGEARESGRCGNCRYCQRDRAALEQAFPGLSALGSAFGASLGDSRLCLRQDRLVSPQDGCALHRPCLLTAG